MSSDLRTRAVLAPTMLLIIGLVYWADVTTCCGLRQGTLCAGLLALLGLGGVAEFIGLLRGAGFAVSKKTLLVLTAALLGTAMALGWRHIDRELIPLVGITLLLLFPLSVQSLRRDDMARGLEKQGATLLGFISIAWPMYLAIGICFRHLPSMLWMVLVCKGGDIGGYCLGRLFGRTKLIPHISPGKTVEGAVGSLIASIGIAVWLRPVLLLPEVDVSVLATIGMGVALNFTTQAGDLIESLLKRRCGAKDSSRLLPAHGGILDLVDSLLYSACVWFLALVCLT